MGTTSTLYDYIDQSGVIVPDTSTILGDVQTEYQDAFGADLIVTPDTPQGVLITAEALARAAVAQNNATLANLINPNIAGGVALDALLALTGMQRAAAVQTLVINVTVTGVAGTIIPVLSQAQTAAGDLFQTLSAVTIPSSGTTQVNFASVAYGAIPCASNALTQIVSSILGWETVNNNPSSTPASSTTLGQATQSDQQARALRNNTLAFQAVALPVAITSALYATPGVTSLFFQENISASTQTINGISMTGHSIYACVNGGSDTAVAAALLENKSSGCGWNGSTSVSVVEPASGQTYTVQFDRPTQVGILVVVNTTNGNAASITQSVLDYANGLIDGFAGFVVGANVSAFDIMAGIASENLGVYISGITIALETGGPAGTTPIAIGVNQIAYIQESYITVNVS